MANVYNSLMTGIAIRVEKAAATLPQSTTGDLFRVSGGRVIIFELCGEVTTIIQAGANNMKIIANPTVGADVDLCAVVNIDGDAVGTMYHITGTLSDALVATTSGAYESGTTPVCVAAGDIELSCSASKTGAIKWVLFYAPLDEGAKVVAL